MPGANGQPPLRGGWQWQVAVGRDDYCDHTVARNLEGKSAALPFRRAICYNNVKQRPPLIKFTIATFTTKVLS
jgi:hypothetical protein